jgi:alpha-acetolactate decarboxylase
VGEVQPFNMAQFRRASDVEPAFKKADYRLGKSVPILFFDEFDSSCDGVKLAWLKAFLGPVTEDHRPAILFYATRLDSQFAAIHTRAVCKVEHGVGLVEAAHAQSEFDFTDVDGTIVGFWTPAYAQTVNIAGWHLHFLTAARDGGGHVLQLQAQNLRVQMQHLDDFRMAIPETADFLKADLTGDPSRALDQAERPSHGGRKPGCAI